MKKFYLSFVMLGTFSLFILPTIVQAEEDSKFESVVADSKASLIDEKPGAHESDPLESVQLEAGGSLVGSYVTIAAPGLPGGSVALKGFDFHLGIELFNPHWLTEGSFRSFGSESVAQNFAASLQEFDLKLVYKSDLQKRMQLRFGLGMSARYLKMMDSRNGYSEINDQTPALVGILGIERMLTSKVSLGPDISYRAPLVQETSERGSIDASLRLNFLF
jgi:hypothetical protein